MICMMYVCWRNKFPERGKKETRFNHLVSLVFSFTSSCKPSHATYSQVKQFDQDVKCADLVIPDVSNLAFFVRHIINKQETEKHFRGQKKDRLLKTMTGGGR
jgi:hypothetical protein